MTVYGVIKTVKEDSSGAHHKELRFTGETDGSGQVSWKRCTGRIFSEKKSKMAGKPAEKMDVMFSESTKTA